MLFRVFQIRCGCIYITLKLGTLPNRRYLAESFRSPGFLQGLELIDPLLGVAHTDLTEGLVLVAAGPDVLGVEQIVLRLLVIISGLCQLCAQELQREQSPVIKP